MHHELNKQESTASSAQAEATTVSESTAGLVVIWAGFPLAGGLAGWLLMFAADWIFRLPISPLPGWLVPLTEFISRSPYPTLVAVSLGVIGGIVFAVMTKAELLIVKVDDAGVTLSRDSTEKRVPAESIAIAFLEDDNLVILGQRTEELAVEPCDLDSDKLQAAFRSHGIPWNESDPYAESFQRWVPERPELSPGADAFFKARQEAIEGDDEDDARDLRSELANMGIVVRDAEKRQYFRLINSSTNSPGQQHPVEARYESG